MTSRFDQQSLTQRASKGALQNLKKCGLAAAAALTLLAPATEASAATWTLSGAIGTHDQRLRLADGGRPGRGDETGGPRRKGKGSKRAPTSSDASEKRGGHHKAVRREEFAVDRAGRAPCAAKRGE